MRRTSHLTAWTVLFALLLGWTSAATAAPGEQEKKRKALQEKLGLPKGQTQPEKERTAPADGTAPGTPEDDGDPGAEDPVDAPGAEPGAGSEPGAKKRRTTFARVGPMLSSSCGSCHKTGASASRTKYVITGDVDADYANARKLTNRGNPESSVLLTKGAGQGHGGGGPWPKGSSRYGTLLAWIQDGTPKGGTKGGGAAVVATPAPAPGTKRPAQPAPADKPAPQAAPEAGTGDPAAPAEPSATGPTYAADIHPIVSAKCGSCHAKGAPAGGGSLGLTGEVEPDYTTVRALVNPGQPDTSPFLSKGSGEAHGGGATVPKDSPEYAAIRAWIEAGAPLEAGEAPAPDAMTGASKKADPTETRLGDGTPLGPEGKTNKLPFGLPFGLQIHGKFDFSYERRNYKDHPFGPGKNQFQTYHHFLFLSRYSENDPFGIDVELLTQAFYEFNARIAPEGKPYRFFIKAGKILVPFGNEPLFHNSYGGKTGFDQELLPVIWAQPGFSANAQFRFKGVTLSNDLYVVQGYALRNPENVLNLQGDISSLDNFRASFGDRIGLSYAPLTVWYSFLFNYLGNDRLLFMQAVDLEFWRLARVPFLRDFVLGLGGMRADVSGGGPGEDYFHFGSYAFARYYPINQFFVQYRAGLKTFDNRQGLYFDDRRVDERDNSSHNVTFAGRYRGFYAGLQLFWNLEKANELDNDFMRLTVGYEF